MPATCSYYRVGPDAETACSRCARISRCPVGLHHAPSCFYLANSRLRATARVAAARASRSKLSASSKTALLAPGSVNCPATSRACSARSSHSKASFNGDGIRSSHSVYKTVYFRRGGRLAPSRQLFVHEKRLPNGGLGTANNRAEARSHTSPTGPSHQTAAAAVDPPQASWKTRVRTSILSRGSTLAGAVGSSKAECAVKRAVPSSAES